MSDTLLNLAPS